MNDLNLIVKEWLFDEPLYTRKTGLTAGDNQQMFLILTFIGTVDAFNPTIKQETTYSIQNSSFISKNSFSLPYAPKPGLEDLIGFSEIKINCLRTNEEFRVFAHLAKKTENSKSLATFVLQKVGQFPSIADLHISRIRDYSTVLSNSELKEFTRAVGLAAAGIGIGSFVYLRRIFENLIEEAHKTASEQTGWNEGTYSKQRMNDRIEILKDYLPAFLVSQRKMYSILSKGIHELSEEECLSNFTALRLGIEIILDEKVVEYEREKKIKEATRLIDEANKKLK